MKIKSEFILRQIASSWIIFSLEQERSYGVQMLNDSGAMLWHRLEQGCTEEDLVTALTNEYEVTPQQASADVGEFLEKLRSIGCIE